MKQNKLTPGSNLFWESSRMMLPEHKEALLQHKKEQSKKVKPILDDQMQRIIGYAIELAYSTNAEIVVTVFGEYEDEYVTGKITRIDGHQQRIKIEFEDDYNWIHYDDILLVKKV